jgi:ribosomal protein S27AE
MLVGNAKIDIDKPVPCPHCGESLVLDLPVSVTTGYTWEVRSEHVDFDAAEDIKRWTCCECGEFDGFPEGYNQKERQL